MPFASWRVMRRAAPLFALVLGLGGTVIYADVLNDVQRIEGWLFWQLAPLWAAVVLFSVAATCVGSFLLERVLRWRPSPALEAAVLSMALGTVVFVLSLFLAGVLGLFHPALALLLPLGFIMLGARSGLGLWRRFREQSAQSPHTFVGTAAAVLGIVCLTFQYLPLLTPDALNYDSTWHHLKVSQDYARWGEIRPFPGDYNPALPHLTGVLQTWSFLFPGLQQAQRWILCLHLEFTLFLWTLAGVAAAVQRLLARPTLRATWVAFFLFPIIFVYDSNLGGAADHVFAFFVMPALIVALEACRTFSRSSSILLGAFLGAMALTKYQVIYTAVPLLLLCGGAWAYAGWKRRRGGTVEGDDAALRERQRRDWALAPLLLALSGLVVFAPQPLLNVAFHENPVYPFLQRVFTASTPSVPEGWLYVAHVFQDNTWVPQGTLLQKLGTALKLFFTFSFEPHYSFTNNVPAFGSLFTLLLPGLLLVRRAKAIAPAALVASVAILMWALTFNVDRNLQTFAPLLVCVTAALLVELWALGPVARLGLVPLVALQLVWGGDTPFYSSQERLRSSLELIQTSYQGRAENRFDRFRSTLIAIGESLPEDALVLIHGSHLSLGLNRDTVLDWAGFQGLIEYREQRSPRELWDYYRRLGVTHLLYTPGERPASSKQEEILFHALAAHRGQTARSIGSYRLVTLSERPPLEQELRVVSAGIPGYADGLYDIRRLGTVESLPARLRQYQPPNRALDAGNALELLKSADAVVLSGPSPAGVEWDTELRSAFVSAIRYYGSFEVWVRRTPAGD